ncbi:hypothetical protein D9615_008673 [Tricholomella constricta]|uniref:F-box domain-containing protein n=1 Tax=Tricholomella constricta TaxID=117010 RepID=A0A8H5H4A3_9AGAR|nr:hypothetical protein D9615_008673 [Tricholomella constricta]
MCSSMLPLELINMIIDELAGDKPALSACSLTSSSLREQAQKHLFSDIVLDLDTIDPSSSDDLHDILYSNPHLASFVVSLKVQFSQPSEWEFVIARHVALLNRFPRVRSVTLTSPTSGKDLWRIIQRNLRVALLTLIQQSTVESPLILEHQGSFPAQIISHCWQLKHLSMQRCLLQDSRYKPRMSTEIGRRPHSRQQGHLESLSVEIASDLLLTTLIQPTSSLSLSRLHTLDISDIEAGHIHALQKILDVASSLTWLELGIKYIPTNPADPANPMISLRALTRLEVLTLTCGVCYRPGLAAHLLHIIASLPAASRGIKTYLSLSLKVQAIGDSPRDYPEEWRLLDTTFTAMLAAGVLALLQVSVRTLHMSEDEVVNLEDLLRGLVARRCLYLVDRSNRSV